MTETLTKLPSGDEDSASVQASTRRLGAAVLHNYSGLVIWAALIALFGIIVPDTFLTSETLRSILSDQAITAILALALLLPLAAGVYDLSVAAMMGLAITLVAWLQVDVGVGYGLAIVLTIGAGVLVGLFNAAVIIGFRVDSFIATLGSSSILLALIQWISGGQPTVEGISPGFLELARTQLFSLALPVFYMVAIAAVLWYLTEYRQVGRYIYATGSNTDAARLAGVRTDRLRALALVAAGTIASIAGVIYCAKIGSAAPEAGPPYLLPAFAGAFLGATQVRAGRVNVLGTLIAVFLLATGVKGLQLAGAEPWVSDAFNGVALILAVALAARAWRSRAS